MILLALKYGWVKNMVSLMIIGTFILTLSFLITTPSIWRTVDVIIVTDFSILKDLLLLGIAIMLLNSEKSQYKITSLQSINQKCMQERIETIFAKIIDEYSPLLLSRAYYLLSNKEDAEDLVQEVFYIAYINYGQYNGKGSVLSWLQGILYKKAIDKYKQKYKYGTKMHVNFTSEFDKHGEWNGNEQSSVWFENETEKENLLDNVEFRDAFYGCIDSLPDKWRLVVKMCYLNENKTEDICSELNITTSNYWKLLQRSRLQLRKCIEFKWFRE